MARGIDAGKTFLAGVLEKLPQELRGEAQRLFENPVLQQSVGDGTLAQAEFSRLANELQTQQSELETRAEQIAQRDEELSGWHQQLTTWYGANKDLVEEANNARRTGYRPAAGTPYTPANGNAAAPPGLTSEVLEERISQERAGFLGFQRDQNLLQREHFGAFGEILDIDPLLTHPRVAELGLRGVYGLIHKDRLEAHKTKLAQEAEEKIRLDERSKILAQQAQLPYVAPTGAGSGSPLDALAVGKPDSLVESASAHYTRLQAERAGSSHQ